MDDATQAALTSAVVSNLIIPLLLIAGGYLITLVPGPIRNWLASSTHERDMSLLLGAMARAAAAALVRSPASAPSAVAAVVVDYAKANVPDTLSKLAPDDATLRTMATAAAAEAAARLKGAVRP